MWPALSILLSISLKLRVKSLKEGRTEELGPFLREFPTKSLLACLVMEVYLKVERNSWDHNLLSIPQTFETTPG